MNSCSDRNIGALRAHPVRARVFSSALALAALLAFTASPTLTLAQSNTTGAIAGQVAKGSKVTVESTSTGYSRTATASDDGSYRIGALPPGSYNVKYIDSAGVAQTTPVEVALSSTSQVGSNTGVLELERFVVGRQSVNPIDFTNTEAVTLFNEKMIDSLPILRDPTSVALLAPGTVLGDSGIDDEGALASFGGASIAENAYFVNGFNIANFRNGMNPGNVPFEFYENIEVKTGAYSAEFGRSTGGVINTTTKRGSNQYKAGANIIFSPNFMREDAPSSYFTNLAGTVVPRTYNDADYSQEIEANVYASGPLWKDKLFFYGLYQLSDKKAQDAITNGTQLRTRTSDDPFWGAKLDFTPFTNHSLEYTGYSDKSRRTSSQVAYNILTKTAANAAPVLSFEDRGGTTHIGSYRGVFMEKLTVSAMFGKSTQNRTDSSPEDDKIFIFDRRTGSNVYVQGNPALLVSQAEDQREATRLDFEYSLDFLGSHRFRAGFDREDNLSGDVTRYSGGQYLRLEAVPSSGTVNGATIPAGTTVIARNRKYSSGGSYTTKSNAWYIEDSWSLMKDRLNARLGLRNESFENLNVEGDTFIEVKNQYAPRLGVSYDLFGDKKTKIFANFGRYHLPIAANTNIRLAGNELFTETYNVVTSVGADGKNPVLGAQIGVLNEFSDGTIRDRREIVDMDIKPMYQDEYVVGIQHALTKQVSIGMRFTNRQLDGTAMDDVIVDHALNTWAKANGFPAFDATGEHAFVLANPGRPIHMFWDFNENGTLDKNEEAILSAASLQYPSAVRKYYALELFAEKVWDNKWSAQVSYTWAQSYGNYEGWVLSDNDQDDAGITILFDSPLTAKNTYGPLPNDRRHQFKAFGAYALTPELTLGANVLLTSGRPINKFGNLLDPIRGNTNNDYALVPRGSIGTTPWIFSTDLTLAYKPKWAKGLTMSVDVFNILNRDAKTELIETSQTTAGGVEPSYGTTFAWQAPRSLRFSLGYDF